MGVYPLGVASRGRLARFLDSGPSSWSRYSSCSAYLAGSWCKNGLGKQRSTRRDLSAEDHRRSDQIRSDQNQEGRPRKRRARARARAPQTYDATNATSRRRAWPSSSRPTVIEPLARVERMADRERVRAGRPSSSSAERALWKGARGSSSLVKARPAESAPRSYAGKVRPVMCGRVHGACYGGRCAVACVCFTPRRAYLRGKVEPRKVEPAAVDQRWAEVPCAAVCMHMQACNVHARSGLTVHYMHMHMRMCM